MSKPDARRGRPIFMGREADGTGRRVRRRTPPADGRRRRTRRAMVGGAEAGLRRVSGHLGSASPGQIGPGRARGDDRVPAPPRLLLGKVAAVVASAALAALEGRLRDQSADVQHVAGLETGPRYGILREIVLETKDAGDRPFQTLAFANDPDLTLHDPGERP